MTIFHFWSSELVCLWNICHPSLPQPGMMTFSTRARLCAKWSHWMKRVVYWMDKEKDSLLTTCRPAWFYSWILIYLSWCPRHLSQTCNLTGRMAWVRKDRDCIFFHSVVTLIWCRRFYVKTEVLVLTSVLFVSSEMLSMPAVKRFSVSFAKHPTNGMFASFQLSFTVLTFWLFVFAWFLKCTRA